MSPEENRVIDSVTAQPSEDELAKQALYDEFNEQSQAIASEIHHHMEWLTGNHDERMLLIPLEKRVVLMDALRYMLQSIKCTKFTEVTPLF